MQPFGSKILGEVKGEETETRKQLVRKDWFILKSQSENNHFIN